MAFLRARNLGSADKMRSPRFAQMRCIYSGQRQPIMRRTSHLHSWDVFAYEPLPNRLRPSDLTLGRLSKETNQRRSGATSRICRRREDSADVWRWGLNLSVIPKEIHKPTAIQQNGGGLRAIISPRLSGGAESPCRRPPRCRGHGEICPYRASRSYRCPRSGSCPVRSRRQE